MKEKMVFNILLSKKNNKKLLGILSLFSIKLLLSFSGNNNVEPLNAPRHTLYLRYPKNSAGSLKNEFLKELSDIFKIDVFIETGTWRGETTNNAISCFKEIHTIELSPGFYKDASERFKNNYNVHVHLGDSLDILPKILPTIKRKILFWLDGHYSEGGTAKGKQNTPLLNELRIIKENSLNRPIILIDDIRQCQHFEDIPVNQVLKGWPTVGELKNAILEIDKNYRFLIYGDTALAYHSEELVDPSPVIQACTISRLSNDEKFSPQLLIEMENVIAQSQGEERETIQQLHKIFSFSENRHKTGQLYRFWYGLTLLYEKKYSEAYSQFYRALDLGFNAAHIAFYLP